MDAIRPYRETDVSPLEALVRRGPSDAVSREIRQRQARIGLTILGMYAAGQLIPVLPPLAIVVLPLLTVLGMRMWRDRHRSQHELQRLIAGLPIPVDAFPNWQGWQGAAAVVDLVIDQPSVLADHAVRNAAPTAIVVTGPDGIHVAWDLPLERRSLHLLHLLTTLLPHREELGLTRLRFNYRPKRPQPLPAPPR